jgi:hypothetical protein
MFPIGSSRRRLLNLLTHAKVAYSTASKLRHRPRRWSGASTDPKADVAVRFAEKLVRARGQVSEADLSGLAPAGYSASA